MRLFSAPRSESDTATKVTPSAGAQSRGIIRIACSIAILACDALSAILSYVPLAGITLVLMQVKANLIGPSEQIIHAGEDDPAFELVLIVFWLVNTALTLIPAIIGNSFLHRRAGWPKRVCVIIAIIIIPVPVIVDFIAPLGSINIIWTTVADWLYGTR